MWISHRKHSVVSDLFEGVERSQVKCLECGRESFKYDPFMTVLIEIGRCGDVGSTGTLSHRRVLYWLTTIFATSVQTSQEEWPWGWARQLHSCELMPTWRFVCASVSNLCPFSSL